MANDLTDRPPLGSQLPKDITPGWMRSPTCCRLRHELEHRAARGEVLTRWLMSRRIAGQIVEELRPHLSEPEQRTTRIENLTGLFGLPVELVADLPQGAVLR
jgi:hypothetical protein